MNLKAFDFCRDGLEVKIGDKVIGYVRDEDKSYVENMLQHFDAGQAQVMCELPQRTEQIGSDYHNSVLAVRVIDHGQLTITIKLPYTIEGPVQSIRTRDLPRLR